MMKALGQILRALLAGFPKLLLKETGKGAALYAAVAAALAAIAAAVYNTLSH